LNADEWWQQAQLVEFLHQQIMDQIQTGMAFLRKVVLRKPILIIYGGQINLVRAQ
jgi:hypothetical protein